jgi:hypothetical protein
MLNLAVLYFDLMPYLWEVTRTWQAAYLGSRFQGEVISLASILT